jgi:hypothetical protein
MQLTTPRRGAASWRTSWSDTSSQSARFIWASRWHPDTTARTPSGRCCCNGSERRPPDTTAALRGWVLTKLSYTYMYVDT